VSQQTESKGAQSKQASSGEIEAMKTHQNHGVDHKVVKLWCFGMEGVEISNVIITSMQEDFYFCSNKCQADFCSYL
jgi:hypothetical protein